MRRPLALIAMFVALMACADESDEGETLPSAETSTSVSAAVTDLDPAAFETWREATRAVCATFEPQLDSLEAELGEPDSVGEIASYVDALTPLNDEYIDALTAIELPNGRGEEVRRTYELYEAQRSEAAALGATAASGDEAGVATHSEALGVQSQELRELLQSLDLPECL